MKGYFGRRDPAISDFQPLSPVLPIITPFEINPFCQHIIQRLVLGTGNVRTRDGFMKLNMLTARTIPSFLAVRLVTSPHMLYSPD